METEANNKHKSLIKRQKNVPFEVKPLLPLLPKLTNFFFYDTFQAMTISKKYASTILKDDF